MAKQSFFDSKTKIKPKLSMTPSLKDEEDDNKCVDIIKKYFVETSIHGLKYIYESGRHIIERLFWVLSFLFMATSAVYLIYQV